jgi:hypothetical protein
MPDDTTFNPISRDAFANEEPLFCILECPLFFALAANQFDDSLISLYIHLYYQ